MKKLKDILNEIGNAPLAYTKYVDSNDELIYKFSLDDGTEFDVNIFVRKKGVIEIDFFSDYSWETTNRGKDVFTIFATIKEIIKEVISKLKVHSIIYDASGKKESVYKKLIQQVYPNAKFKINYFGSTVVSIKN
jgi:hypothetical protein